MIAIIDYGVGNLFSLSASLKKLEIPTIITNDHQKIADASHIILPGVGAFGDASEILRNTGLDQIVIENSKKKPLMGICLGMQLLFEKGYEFGEYDGLGLIPGDVVGMKDKISSDLKVPHMGWNKLDIKSDCPILKYTKSNDYVYFVHSFYAKTPEKFVAATANYDIDLTATVQNENIFGCQFHPEKSGEVGLRMLKAFYEYN
ncbi:MAG: imidazole glycerol phosphate synthase subunit HisH [Clostridia bacterium]